MLSEEVANDLRIDAAAQEKVEAAVVCAAASILLN
jgi:hypothetical protein